MESWLLLQLVVSINSHNYVQVWALFLDLSEGLPHIFGLLDVIFFARQMRTD